MSISRATPDRIERLEQLLRQFSATYRPDHSITRQGARNLAAARPARDEAREDPETGDPSPEAAR